MSRELRGAVVSAVLCCAIGVSASADDHELLLRAQDAVAAPGGLAVVTLRTYATRPVGQGTICMRFGPEQGEVLPLASLKGVRVFAQANDVVQSVSASNQNGAMIVDIVFSSPSASINEIDGPFAALFFDIAPNALPGAVVQVDIEPGLSALTDEKGQSIPIEVRSGELEIRHPDAPVEVAAEAHLPDFPGMPVTLSFQTNEPFQIATGQVGIRYSNRELTGEPVMRHDERFGKPGVKLDGHPGLTIFNIVSGGVGFNEVTGNILSVDIMPNPAFAFGNEPVIELDPALTHLFDQEGRWISIEIEDAVYALPEAPHKEQSKRRK